MKPAWGTRPGPSRCQRWELRRQGFACWNEDREEAQKTAYWKWRGGDVQGGDLLGEQGTGSRGWENSPPQRWREGVAVCGEVRAGDCFLEDKPRDSEALKANGSPKGGLTPGCNVSRYALDCLCL